MKNDTITIAKQLNIKEFPFVIKDKQGNLLYFENSNGFWGKKEYDSKGNTIYYENSHGDWSKYEYDSVGNRIYYENSKNDVITLNGIKYQRIDSRD